MTFSGSEEAWLYRRSRSRRASTLSSITGCSLRTLWVEKNGFSAARRILWRSWSAGRSVRSLNFIDRTTLMLTDGGNGALVCVELVYEASVGGPLRGGTRHTNLFCVEGPFLSPTGRPGIELREEIGIANVDLPRTDPNDWSVLLVEL
jgi:hypothetical protein